MEKETDGGLSAEEQAYFDTRGESVPEQKAEPAPEEAPAETPEPAAEPDAEPESEPEAAEEPDDKPTGKSPVPLAALTKTRNELKEAKKAREDAERRAAILEDRWNMVLAAQQQPQEQKTEPPAIPDPETDPIGALKWMREQVSGITAKSAEQEKQQREGQQRQEAWNRTVATVSKAFNDAAAEDPTVNEAYQAIFASAAGEMKAMGLSDPEIKAQLTQLENQHISFIASRNLDIPAYVKGLAGARGWKPAEPPKKDEPKPEEQIDKLAKNVEESTSLSAANGAAPTTLSAQAIADMSPSDFEAWYSKPDNQKKFRRLAGG